MRWSSAASSALPARSVRTTRCSTSRAAIAVVAGVCGAASGILGRIDELDADPLVDPAFRFVARHPDLADLASVRDVRATIRLEVEPDDLDRPDLLDALGQQIDLRADQVGDRERLVARQHVDAHVALGSQLAVD